MRGVLVLFVLGVVLASTATAASAHATLESTDPVNGTTYAPARAPRSVSLRYGEPVGAQLGAVRVYDEEGRLLRAGPPTHPHGDGSTVRVSLPHLGSGTYVVTWRVISADTHPVSGAFTFQIGSGGRDVSQLTTRLLSSAEGSELVGIVYGVARFVVFASVLLVVGAVVFVSYVWPQGRGARGARRVVRGAIGLAVLVSFVAFAVEGVYAAAFPLADLLRSDVLSNTAHARYGQMALLRVALLVALGLLYERASRRSDHEGWPRWWYGASGALAVGLALTLTEASHATTGRWTALAVPADALHVLGASIWLGGLVVLLAVVLAAPATDQSATTVRRFSPVAFAAVVVIIATGVLQSVRQVGSFGALTGTTYGRLLLAKIVAVGVLVAIASASRRVVQHWYDRRAGDTDVDMDDVDDRVLVSVGAAEPPVPPARLATEPQLVAATDRRRHELRVSVFAEVVVAVVVLVITALLVDARPAYEVATGPQIVTMKSDKLWFDVVIDPAVAGRANQVHLTAVTPTGGFADPLEMTMELREPARDVGPLTVPLIRAGPGHLLTYGFVVPFPGRWQVTVRALLSQVDEVTASTIVTVR
jgi:copper transport protein